MGMRGISKFHGLLHLAKDITQFGSPMMFQACRPEHHHEQFCKEPGQRCLMTQNDWDLKVSIKIQESQGLDLLQHQSTESNSHSYNPDSS